MAVGARKKDLGFTEKSMQYFLYKKYKDTHKYIARNKYIFGHWESDLFGMNKAGITTEWEIKITRSDLLKEGYHKPKKHNFLMETWESEGQNLIDSWETKEPLYCPNKFIISVPEGLTDLEEVEEMCPYAGLVFVTKDGKVKSKKNRKIHKVKQDLDHILLNKFYYQCSMYDYENYMLVREYNKMKDPSSEQLKTLIDGYIKKIKFKL